MGEPKKDGKVWRHRVMVNGQRVSGTFETKSRALSWEAEQRLILGNGQAKKNLPYTLLDAFKKYEKEVSIRKRGHKNEVKRLGYFSTSFIADIRLSDLTSADIAKWRDMRLTVNKGSTVNRDMNLLSHVLSTARREWKWIDHNVMSDVSRPEQPTARDRRISQAEIDAICAALGYDNKAMPKPRLISDRVALAFLMAIETAMRAGEICALRREDISGSVARLHMTKNGSARNVPLSKAALKIWALVPNGFGLTPRQLDANFRKYRKLSGVVNLKFHDTRHEAITRLAQKINVLDLARMVGHKNIRELQTYYNESAADIAKKLD